MAIQFTFFKFYISSAIIDYLYVIHLSMVFKFQSIELGLLILVRTLYNDSE